MTIFRRVTAVVLALGAGLSHAQDDMDGLLDGFQDDGLYDSISLPDEQSTQVFKDQAVHWDGRVQLAASWNLRDHTSGTGTDYSDLSQLRIRLDAGFSADLGEHWKTRLSLVAWHDAAYQIQDESYTDEVLSAYEQELDSGEAWIQGRLAKYWDIKLGRQVAAWGFSDNLRVLDVLNPLDNLEPGLADIEDLRRPTGMLRIDHFQGPWQLSLFATPEQRFSRNPPYGSDFYGLNDAEGRSVQYREIRPQDFDSINSAASLVGRFSGWDASLNISHHWQDAPYLDARAFDSNAANASQEQFVRDAVLRHSRVNLFGFGLQKTIGSWLFKQEAAWIDQIELTSSSEIETGLLNGLPILGALLPGGETTILPTDIRKTSETHLLLGLEYFGIAQTNISVDIAARYIEDFDTDLAWSGYLRWRSETALRITRDFLNERLRCNLIAVLFNQDGRFLQASGGALYRIDLSYELAPAWTLFSGAVFYQAGDQIPFNRYGENDRIFAKLERAF